MAAYRGKEAYAARTRGIREGPAAPMADVAAISLASVTRAHVINAQKGSFSAVQSATTRYRASVVPENGSPEVRAALMGIALTIAAVTRRHMPALWTSVRMDT